MPIGYNHTLRLSEKMYYSNKKLHAHHTQTHTNTKLYTHMHLYVDSKLYYSIST